MKHLTRVGPNVLEQSDKGPKTTGWKNTNDLLTDICRIMKAFDQGKLDAEAARVYVANFRNAAAILTIQLEHARLTNRLKDGEKTLAGIALA